MNLKLFKKRLIAFYSSWIQSNKDLWGNSDVIVIYTAPANSQANQLSSQFHSWLLGRDFHDTIVIFSRTAIYFLSPKRKVPVLQTLIVPIAESVKAKVVIHRKEPGNYGFGMLDEIIRGLRMKIVESGENRAIVIGCVTGESPRSNLLWSGANQSKYRSASVEIGMRKLFSHGDCVSVQMECLPDKFEEMLNMANESRGKVGGEKEVFGERENGKESGLISSEKCGLGSDEFDEQDWVLVEDYDD